MSAFLDVLKLLALFVAWGAFFAVASLLYMSGVSYEDSADDGRERIERP